MLERILSPSAAELYHRLIADHFHIVDGVDALDECQGELVASGFARVQPGDVVRLVPVTPAAAAQIVLHDLTDTIAQWHRDTARTVEELIRLEPHDPGDGSTLLARVITDLDRITTLVHDIQAGARDELLSLEVPIDAGIVCKPVLSPAADNPPARWRTIFTTGYLVPEFQWIPDTVAARGGGVHVIGALPTKLLIADRTFALLPLDRPGVAGVVLFRSDTVIATLAALFDALWEQSSPYPNGNDSEGALTPFEQHVVALLASGLKDEDIATRTHVSIRTVRRHVASILEKLAVNTRFAAGIQAAKRGWV